MAEASEADGGTPEHQPVASVPPRRPGRRSSGRATGRRSGRSRWRRRLVVVLVLVVLFLAASVRLFVWPPTDQPARADAVVALAGAPQQHRPQFALHLAEEGYAPVAVISVGDDPSTCPAAPAGVKVICFAPNPVDTRGEAEEIGRLVASHHWHRIIVVPVRTQVTRARLLIERCTSAHLLMVPVALPASHLPYELAYEWGSLAKALFLKTAC